MIPRPFASLLALASLSALTACAPPTLTARPVGPIAATPGETFMDETRVFTAPDGAQLFEQSWHPTGPVRAVLVIHHGLKDHSTRYGDFAQRLTARGFAVYAYDMRGHGHSSGMRAALDRFDDLTGDLGRFMDRVRQREAGRPVFLLGHSVGGAVVTLFTLERRPELAGLIVLAPALRVDRSPLEAAATPLAAALLPNFGAVDTPDEEFSRSPEVVAEMGADPLVWHPAGPARTAAALVAALERIWALADTLDVPVLGVHGTVDRLTDPRGTAELIRRARHRDHTLVLYRGLRHDLIHEPEREQVIDDLVRWLDERAPAATATPAAATATATPAVTAAPSAP